MCLTVKGTCHVQSRCGFMHTFSKVLCVYEVLLELRLLTCLYVVYCICIALLIVHFRMKVLSLYIRCDLKRKKERAMEIFLGVCSHQEKTGHFIDVLSCLGMCSHYEIQPEGPVQQITYVTEKDSALLRLIKEEDARRSAHDSFFPWHACTACSTPEL